MTAPLPVGMLVMIFCHERIQGDDLVVDFQFNVVFHGSPP